MNKLSAPQIRAAMKRLLADVKIAMNTGPSMRDEASPGDAVNAEPPLGDHEALATLKRVLTAAARDLAALEQPALVAACPNKYDDTGHYPDWLAVQVGRASWERTDYRLNEGGDVLEEARNPEDLISARAILTRLQDEQWRAIATRALGVEFGDASLALVVQHDASWFIISASNAGEDLAFLLTASGDLLCAGKAERIDRRIGHARPLLLEWIDPMEWPALREAAPAFPIARTPTTAGLDAQAAGADLSKLLLEAVAVMKSLGCELSYAATAHADPNGTRAGSGWRVIEIDDFRATMQSWEGSERYAKHVKEGSPQAERLDSVLKSLEKARWRDLFAHGVAPLSPGEVLGLLVRGDECLLIAAQCAVYALRADGALDLVGVCDSMGIPSRNLTVHAFKGDLWDVV